MTGSGVSEREPSPATLDASSPFKNWMLYAAVVLGLLFIWMVWVTLLHRGGIQSREALDSAQAARNLVQGRGFSTWVIRPLSLHFASPSDPHPDLVNPPFMTLLQAALFSLGGINDRMVVVSSGLGWLLCGALIFLLVWDVSKSRRIGVLGLAFWIVNPVMAAYGVAGNNVTWSAALLTGLAWGGLYPYRLMASGQPRTWSPKQARARLPQRSAVASGCLGGLLILCEPVLAGCVWIPLLWMWARWPHQACLQSRHPSHGRYVNCGSGYPYRWHYSWRLLLCVAIPALALILPWYGYLLSVTWPEPPWILRSFTALTQTQTYPGESIFRYAVPPENLPGVYWISDFRSNLWVSLRALLPLPELFVHLAGLVPAMCFVVSFFVQVGDDTRILRRRLLIMLVWAVFFFTVWSVNARNFGAFVPLMTVIATIGIQRVLAERWTSSPRLLTSRSRCKRFVRLSKYLFMLTRRHQVYALVVFLAAIPMLNVRSNLPPKSSLRLPPGLALIQAEGHADDVVLTDDPWFVAWYGERRALWLPQRLLDLDIVQSAGIEPAWIYIVSAPVRDEREIGDWWPDMLRQRPRWREFRHISTEFPRERVLQRE